MEREFEMKDMSMSEKIYPEPTTYQESEVDISEKEENEQKGYTLADITGINLLRSVTSTMVDTTIDVGAGIGKGVSAGVSVLKNGTTTVIDGTISGTTSIVSGTIDGVIGITNATTGAVKSVVDTTVDIVSLPIRAITGDEPNYTDYENYPDNTNYMDYMDYFDDSEDYEEPRLLTDSDISRMTIPKKSITEKYTGIEEIPIDDSDSDEEEEKCTISIDNNDISIEN